MTPELKTHRNLKQQLAVSEALKPLLEDIGNQLVEYVDGHSDATVAKMMGFPCTAQNVAHVRKQLYGMLYARKEKGGSLNPASQKDLVRRLHRLERAVCRLVRLTGGDPVAFGLEEEK